MRERDLKLHELIKAHDTHKHFTPLTVSLGDGYCYRHNPIMRNLRDATLAAGYQFTLEDYCQASHMQMASLSEFYRTKKIYYFDNISPLVRIEKTSPRQFKAFDVPLGFRSGLIHDQAHCVWNFLCPFTTFAPDAKTRKESIVITGQTGEAFALAVETLARRHINTLAHEYFHCKNSSRHESKAQLDKAVDIVGFKTAFKLLLLGHLEFQFWYTQKDITAKKFDRILELAGSKEKLKATQKAFLREYHCLGLPKRTFESDYFLIIVNPYYFKSGFGIDETYSSLVNFDPLRAVAKSEKILHALDVAAKFLEFGCATPEFARLLENNTNARKAA